MDNPYETLRDLTRGRRIGADDVRTFVAGLGLPAETADRIAALTPATYIGLAEKLVDEYLG